MQDLLSISQVAREVCSGKVSPHSVRGIVKGIGKPRIKLPATRIGGVYYVSRQEAVEFLAAAGDRELYRRRKQTERTERAKQRLIAAGA